MKKFATHPQFEKALLEMIIQSPVPTLLQSPRGVGTLKACKDAAEFANLPFYELRCALLLPDEFDCLETMFRQFETLDTSSPFFLLVDEIHCAPEKIFLILTKLTDAASIPEGSKIVFRSTNVPGVNLPHFPDRCLSISISVNIPPNGDTPEFSVS